MKAIGIIFAALTILVANQAIAAKWEVMEKMPGHILRDGVLSIDKQSIVYDGEKMSFWVKAESSSPQSKITPVRLLFHFTAKCSKRLLSTDQQINSDGRVNRLAGSFEPVEPESFNEYLLNEVCSYKRWLFF